MKISNFILMLLFSLSVLAHSQTIIDHQSTQLSAIPEEWINAAKQNLHIAYGHTSHGSQLVTGMTGLITFKSDLYSFNEGGINGALDLRDTPFSGANDLGSPNWTAWEQATRVYLADNPDVNVIIWSWCGQVSYATVENIDNYLSMMSALEIDFPGVRFVYMTGHLDGSGLDGNLHLRNEQIRDYCRTNQKFLYDFTDIESYDPDGNWFRDKIPNDNCDYDSNNDGNRDSNWAIDWQNAHTENIDWYDCYSAHSQPLNANQKAYAAWWLWARLAGWGAADSTAPVAVNDTISGYEDTNIIIDVLKNDYDPNGGLDPGTVLISVGPYSGNVEINANTGFLTYQPDPEFAGYDSLRYTVSDSSGNRSNPAMTFIRIEAVNDPPVFSPLPPLVTAEDTPVSLAFKQIFPYVNDMECPDSLLVFDCIGTANISANAGEDQLDFIASKDWFGLDSIRLITTDGQSSDTASMSIVVTPKNDPPIFDQIPDTINIIAGENSVISLSDWVTDIDSPLDGLIWSFWEEIPEVSFDYKHDVQELTIITSNSAVGSGKLWFSIMDDSSAVVTDSTRIKIGSDPLAISKSDNQIPKQYILDQNYPNPFNAQTKINYGLPIPSRVKIEIINLLGQIIAEPVNAVCPAGYQTTIFNARDLPSGIYIYQLSTNNTKIVRKMILIK